MSIYFYLLPTNYPQRHPTFLKNYLYIIILGRSLIKVQCLNKPKISKHPPPLLPNLSYLRAIACKKERILQASLTTHKLFKAPLMSKQYPIKQVDCFTPVYNCTNVFLYIYTNLFLYNYTLQGTR